MKQSATPSSAAHRGAGRLLSVIGIDIGQKRDPTAICVAEVDRRRIEEDPNAKGRKEAHYLVRYLQRLALGISYPMIADRLSEICQRVAEQSGRSPVIYVDATGVGAPVVDALRSIVSSKSRLWAVHISHGDQRKEERSERRVTLGKALLVSRLQVLLQYKRLHLPDTAEARALAQELLDYEIRVDDNAHERFGAFRVGTHDDLVTALGLAAQKEPSVSVYPVGVESWGL